MRTCRILQEDTGSPPPDERHFVDDDGTEFSWDPALRKFRPAELPADNAAATAAANSSGGATAGAAQVGAASAAQSAAEQAAAAGVGQGGAAAGAAQPAAVPEYTPDMMRFQGNDEEMVTLEEAKAQEAESAALAEQLQEARAQGNKV